MMTSRIANRSKKRAAQEREYIKLRDAYLLEHPICEVKQCSAPATGVHHMAGRVGNLLTDTSKFLAVCMPHHLYIESHPIESKSMGYSLSRLSK